MEWLSSLGREDEATRRSRSRCKRILRLSGTVLSECPRGIGSEGDAAGGSRLGRPEDPASAVTMKGVPHPEHVAVKVNVVPCQGEDLCAA